MLLIVSNCAWMQVEARAASSTVSRYENMEADAECLVPRSGLGSKLAVMYKHKGGALSKVHNTEHIRQLNVCNCKSSFF